MRLSSCVDWLFHSCCRTAGLSGAAAAAAVAAADVAPRACVSPPGPRRRSRRQQLGHSPTCQALRGRRIGRHLKRAIAAGAVDLLQLCRGRLVWLEEAPDDLLVDVFRDLMEERRVVDIDQILPEARVHRVRLHGIELELHQRFDGLDGVVL